MPRDKSKMVTRLLKKLGSESNVKLVDTIGGTLNQLTGKIEGGTEQITDTTSFVTDVPDSLTDGKVILMGDKQVLIDNSVTISNSTVVNIGADSFRIVFIGGYNHAGVRQFWRIICRG